MKTVERSFTLIVGAVDGKTRVDTYVAVNSEGLVSRALAGAKDTVILIDGVAAKRSRPVREGQTVEVRWTERCFEGVEPQDLPLQILYEDDDVLVIDKAQGMVVHPAAGNPDGTLVNALVYRYGASFARMDADDDRSEDDASSDDSDIPAPAIRPGIVHRLDKDTSGVMVVARNRQAHAALARQFKDRTTEKYYIAIVKGRMPSRRGRIVTGIRRDGEDRKRFTVCPEEEGKRAETQYLVLRQYDGYALLRIRILTGRTHQIRVHMQSIGHPVLGDSVYSRKDGSYPDASLMLHALQIRFDHPSNGGRVRFVAPMPPRFKAVLRSLSPLCSRPGDETMFLE
jgi:23S rRNA pseudouridine1911/1915/1917 synthase